MLALRFCQGAAVAVALVLLRVAHFLATCLAAHLRWRRCRVPGPKPASVVLGHVPQLAGPKGPWRLAEMVATHGPLLKIQLFNEVQLVLTDPKAIAAATRRTSPYYMPKPREQYKVLESGIQPVMPNILTLNDGDHWKAVRQAVAPCFSTTNLKAVLPLVLQLTQRVADRMALVAAAKQAALFDVNDAAKRITCDVMGHMLLGEDLGLTRWEPSKYLDAFYPVIRAQAAQIAAPWHLLRLWLPEVRHQRRCMALHNRLLSDKAARLMQQPPPHYTIAAHLLSTTDPATGRPLSLDQFKAEIAVFLAAGFETTSHAITWVLAMLAAHPDAQDAVLHELQAAGLAATQDTLARDIAAADLGRLPYLSAVVKEALRLCPPAPWGGSRHVVAEGTELCGYKVAKGTVVMLATLPLALSTANYGPDALEFKPQRWLGGDGGERALEPHTFLAGPRDCVGQTLAKLELTVVLSVLLARFAFAPGPDLARELAAAHALRRPATTAVHALAGAHVTLQPLAGELLLAVTERA